MSTNKLSFNLSLDRGLFSINKNKLISTQFKLKKKKHNHKCGNKKIFTYLIENPFTIKAAN
ncbi:hypothetical protein BpHYR1_007734 [Brachionus plicatilis]|uniref:Uncharacterized protein n=1 Tax=Brachionus plicatilis TaxID=10195 RepID=A0A3M7QN74_BRAPC|nr:hypothetical protein BpHYR1_007734 [Brachionus plicatilis]